MIKTGIDLTEIDRIRAAMKNDRFLKRFFSAEENVLFAGCNLAPQTVAANFAAKEAFAKALGTGIRGFSLKEVSVLRDALGAPYFSFSGRAATLVKESGLCFSVSLTHTDNTAAAVVVAYPTTFGQPV